MRKVFFSALLLGSFANLASAVDVPDICSTAFSRGISDNYEVLSKEDQFNIYKQRILDLKADSFQSFSSSATAIGLDVTTVYGILGLTGSADNMSQQFQQSLSDFRQSTYSESRYSQFFHSNQTIIDQQLVKSWQNCTAQFYSAWMTANSVGVSASVVPAAGLGVFVVALHVSPLILQQVKVVSINPTGLVDCVWGNNQPVVPGLTAIGLVNWSMTCHKDPALQLQFSVTTEGGQTPFLMVPKATSELDDLQESVKALRTDLANLQSQSDQQVAALKAQIAALDAKQSGAVAALENKIPRRVILGNNYACGPTCPGNGFVQANHTADCPGIDQIVSGVGGGSQPGEIRVMCRGLTLSQ